MAVCFFIFLIDSAPNLKLRLKILKKQGCKYSKLIKRDCKNCSLDTENLFCWWKKYYSNLTRILFSRLWLIRLSHRAENPLEKLILAVLNGPKLNLFDCLIIGPITVDVIHLNHSSKIRFREPHFVRTVSGDRPSVDSNLSRRTDPELGKKREKTSRLRILIDRRATEREKKRKLPKRQKRFVF